MTVVATVGGTNSDSYLTNTEADNYWGKRNNADWENASDVNKDSALIRATQYLDSKYEWIGDITDTNQSLNWPRINAVDSQFRDLTGIIPIKVKNACAELALIALNNDLVDSVLDRGGQTKREKVGELEIEYFPGADINKVYSFVDMMLSDYVINSSSTVSILRA